MTTSRDSDRCPSAGQEYDLPAGATSRIIDCPTPTCGRPVTVMENGRIANHGSVRTRNTDAWDDRLRMYRHYGIR